MNFIKKSFQKITGIYFTPEVVKMLIQNEKPETKCIIQNPPFSLKDNV
jgi:hypothetical protein